MKITQVSVSYGETQSLPEYSNVKPALTLTATIDADDDAAVAEAALWQLAKQSVHAQIDTALEANDRPAKYDRCPRYQVMHTYWDRYYDRAMPEPPKLVVILPSEIKLKTHNGVKLTHGGNVFDSRRLRLAHAERVAGALALDLGAAVIDCADGDLARLDAMLPAVADETEEHPF